LVRAQRIPGAGLGGTKKGVGPQQFVFENNLFARSAASLEKAGAVNWTAQSGRRFTSAGEMGLQQAPDGALATVPGNAAAAVYPGPGAFE
jgi:hypothetical protein